MKAADKHTEIGVKTLNSSISGNKQFTLNLLHEAYLRELLTEKEINKIQQQILLVLKDLILRYTNGESTSISADKAEGFLNSILYALDAGFASLKSPFDAVLKLKADNIITIYNEGVEQLRLWHEEAIILYKKVRKTRVKTTLEAYNLTIEKGIPLFLQSYGIIFDSHNSMADIDYPLVFDDMSIYGINYMRNYLKTLFIENIFCNYFCSDEIENILLNYGKLFKLDYKIELINIFELVFNNSVFSIIAGNKKVSLTITGEDSELINSTLSDLESEKVEALLNASIQILIESFNINEPALLEYIRNYERVFIGRVKNSIINSCLNSLIITDKKESIKEGLFKLEVGRQLENGRFIKLTEKLNRICSTKIKIKLIKACITSMYDFLDILDTGCFYEKEYEQLYEALDAFSLAVLFKIVFYQELRNDYSIKKAIKSIKKGETEWQEYFIIFIIKLPEKRLSEIESHLCQIDYEEIKFN